MPSPIAHSTAGLFVYYLLLRFRPKLASAFISRKFLLLSILAVCNLPDTDILFSWFFSGSLTAYHQTFTHNLPFITVASTMLALLVPLRYNTYQIRLQVFCFFLFILGVHILFDASVGEPLLGSSTLGVKIFWPFSVTRYGAPISFFPMLYFDNPKTIVSWQNIYSLLYESALALFFLLPAWWLNKQKSKSYAIA